MTNWNRSELNRRITLTIEESILAICRRRESDKLKMVGPAGPGLPKRYATAQQ